MYFARIIHDVAHLQNLLPGGGKKTRRVGVAAHLGLRLVKPEIEPLGMAVQRPGRPQTRDPRTDDGDSSRHGPRSMVGKKDRDKDKRDCVLGEVGGGGGDFTSLVSIEVHSPLEGESKS